MEFLFKEFNKEIKVRKLYKGYRLIAVDGSDMTYAPNPKETDCYFQTSGLVSFHSKKAEFVQQEILQD